MRSVVFQLSDCVLDGVSSGFVKSRALNWLIQVLIIRGDVIFDFFGLVYVFALVVLDAKEVISIFLVGGSFSSPEVL